MSASYKRWTKAEDDKMCSLFESGLQNKQIAYIIGRTPRAIQHRRIDKGMVIIKDVGQVPICRSKNRPMIVTKCSYCYKKKVFNRHYYNAEVKKGRAQFFCNTSCSRQFAERSSINRQTGIVRLSGAMKIEARFYKNQQYGVI